MASIGIIANPASGKDIRRLVSYATTIDNREKVNIVKRIILAAQSMGIDTVWFMPDTFQIGWEAIDDLTADGRCTVSCRMLEIPVTASAADTTAAASAMERLGVGCAVVLGGDGTCRAAAKGVDRMPLLPVSTGTNNVYPAMTEGTVAGMAAAITALSRDRRALCIQDKYLEVSVNGGQPDIALIDAAITDDIWVGSRAVWKPAKLRYICVTRCHPASIGFSAVAGCVQVVRAEDRFGLSVKLEKSGEKMIAPVAAGVLEELRLAQVGRLAPDTPQKITAEGNCMIALDGEREMTAHEGDVIAFTLRMNGPVRVLPEKALEEATANGSFYRKTK
jgi:Uncharacterized conserved protein